jgi:hypothetical protein
MNSSKKQRQRWAEFAALSMEGFREKERREAIERNVEPEE